MLTFFVVTLLAAVQVLNAASINRTSESLINNEDNTVDDALDIDDAKRKTDVPNIVINLNKLPDVKEIYVHLVINYTKKNTDITKDVIENEVTAVLATKKTKENSEAPANHTIVAIGKFEQSPLSRNLEPEQGKANSPKQPKSFLNFAVGLNSNSSHSSKQLSRRFQSNIDDDGDFPEPITATISPFFDDMDSNIDTQVPSNGTTFTERVIDGFFTLNEDVMKIWGGAKNIAAGTKDIGGVIVELLKKGYKGFLNVVADIIWPIKTS